MIRTIMATALAAVFTAGAATAATVTVFSDNFDADATGTPVPSLLNWNITVGTVDVVGTSFGWCSVNCLDMNGSSSAEGRIERSINGLNIGQLYELTFDFGTNQSPSNQDNPYQLAFGFGSLPIDSYILPITSQIGMSSSVVYSFVANAASQTLFFADVGGTPNDNGGPLLDNVRLSTVPLPAGGLLLLGALGGFAALRRRKSV